MTDDITLSDERAPTMDAVAALYRSVGWSSARKPEELHRALRGAHRLVTAWSGDALIGLGYAISDGHLVVYYPHLVVHPSHQRRGIGERIMRQLMSHYDGFHQHSIIADEHSVAFYQRLGFVRAGRTEPMWIFDGDEH
jgi:GNAT superfamily N-acetyltransferase